MFPVAPSPPTLTADPLAALRRATRTHHARIDALMDLRRMCDRGHYARILQTFDAFLAAWEPAVAAALPPRWHRWLHERSRRPFLQRDLHSLGVARGEPVALWRLSGAAAAWGSVYVMEGSSLGGQFITRSLAQAGLHPARGAAYFHGWGAATAAMWQEARGILAAELDSPEALDPACEAACQTFDTLSNLLESTLHERTPAA